MKTIVCCLLALCCLAGAAYAQGDPLVASAQRVLKDQGFYYGEITGNKDADTTAAIRRYQIRNGLQINGELNAQTQKSLGLIGGAPAIAQPRATPQPTAAPRAPESADDSDLRDNDADRTEPPASDDGYREPPPQPGYAPGPRGLAPETSGIFDGTPFEVAPPDAQRRAIVGAQVLLMRQGYYRNGVDGVFGPGTEFALRAYQSDAGLAETGRLDMETLASLGLLPGQQERAPRGPRVRTWRRPPFSAPPQERIYIP